ncbi:hypothetical protein PR048_031469 [Dryococelus australis]|uniref:Uncharacterized protein n=1 Tax=Dryococelus australis TaxID=614101 RepID=A0ABQ9G5C8_9NEOP|nr:hypothetical protein PR048_031469 [Dryococelus australis]
MELGDQDKNWAPRICCSTCYVELINWWNGKGNSMFAAPMSWRESKDHVTDCYFCMTNVQGFSNRKSKNRIVYPNLPSASIPVPRSANHPVPSRPAHEEIETDSEDSVGE